MRYLFKHKEADNVFSDHYTPTAPEDGYICVFVIAESQAHGADAEGPAGLSEFCSATHKKPRNAQKLHHSE